MGTHRGLGFFDCSRLGWRRVSKGSTATNSTQAIGANAAVVANSTGGEIPLGPQQALRIKSYVLNLLDTLSSGLVVTDVRIELQDQSENCLHDFSDALSNRLVSSAGAFNTANATGLELVNMNHATTLVDDSIEADDFPSFGLITTVEWGAQILVANRDAVNPHILSMAEVISWEIWERSVFDTGDEKVLRE